MEFVPNLSGTLIRLEEDENSRFRFEIWFDYTKKVMNLIREGAMLAVPNFASQGQRQHLSILEVVTILPMHYALGDDARGFPGFIVEAAKSVVNDWEEQLEEATEDTTKIRCIAIPTNFEVVYSSNPMDQSTLQEESNIPMLGATARLLDTQSTEYVANYGIRVDENVLSAGCLIRDSNVSIKVRVDELVRTHFGIFGFTGAGKSNLLSTLISKIITETDQAEKIKVCFFDLMGEYAVLLIDQLLNPKIDAHLICLGDRTLPKPVFDYINRDPLSETTGRIAAVKSFSRYTLLPKALKSQAAAVETALGSMLDKGCVKVFSTDENMTFYRLFFNSEHSVIKAKKRQTTKSDQRYSLLKTWMDKHGGPTTKIDQAMAIKALESIKQEASEGTLKEFAEDVAKAVAWLERASLEDQVILNCSIAFDEIIRLLNNKQKSCLLIFNSHDPDELRTFAKDLGEAIYENRRRSGEFEPSVSVIFDEADEFSRRTRKARISHPQISLRRLHAGVASLDLALESQPSALDISIQASWRSLIHTL